MLQLNLILSKTLSTIPHRFNNHLPCCCHTLSSLGPWKSLRSHKNTNIFKVSMESSIEWKCLKDRTNVTISLWMHACSSRGFYLSKSEVCHKFCKWNRTHINTRARAFQLYDSLISCCISITSRKLWLLALKTETTKPSPENGFQQMLFTPPAVLSHLILSKNAKP